MKCPICNEKTDTMFCEKCGKSIVDIYLKIIEDLQAEREYNKALQMLSDLKKETDDSDIIQEIKEIEEAILFSKVQSERTQDYESKQEGNSSDKRILSIIIFFIIIIGINMVAFKYFIYDKANIRSTTTDEKTKKNDEKKMQIFSKIIFQDIADVNLNYQNGTYEKDINGDGIKEIVAVFEKNYFVFSKENGGSLIYWYDLKNGIKLLGRDFEIYNIKNSNHEKISGGDGFEITGTNMKYELIDKDKIIFEGAGIKKEITLTAGGIDVQYSSTRTGGLEIKLILEPDFGKIYENGNEIIKIEEAAGVINALNTISQKGILVEYGPENERIVNSDVSGKSLIIKIKNINYKFGIKKIE